MFEGYRGCVAFALLLCAISPWAMSAGSIESRPVQFAKGASSTGIQGSIRGDKTIDYKVRARGGQTMTVSLKTDNGANYFNVLAPGSRDVALFVGATGGNEWRGSLATDGEYTIRVYLMRSAARRSETAHYTLTVAIAGSASETAGAGAAADAKVKGTPYHATGKLPCSMGASAAGASQCDFGVIRGAAGSAEVHVTPPGGFRRVLTFADGKVSAGDGAKVTARASGDDWLVDVNDYEHYRIPNAVVSGG